MNRPKHTTPAQTAATSDLAALDHAHIWHPFTPMRQWRETSPLIIERAQGEFLFDTDGNRYIDGVSSLWCNVHGHRVPQIDQAVRDQLDRVAHTTLLGMASPPSIELAARLAALAPKHQPDAPSPLTKVFYSDAGSTAVEAAFKMAVAYWHHSGTPTKTGFIGFSGAYHGDTTGSMSVGYSEWFHRPFASMVFPTTFAPAPDSCRAPAPLEAPARSDAPDWPSQDIALNNALRNHCLAELSGILERHADKTAAIVIEPLMQGAAGMICQPPGFLRGVADLAKQHDVLLIADEVATGFGRTGTLFACEQEHVVPDLMCLAKGLTGGYLPLAATLATDRIEQAFHGEYADARTFFHGHTYTGNPLACAAALASLDLIESTNLLAHINASAAIITERLGDLADCPHLRDIRQRGIMVGIELCEDRRTGRAFDPATRTAAHLCETMRPKGLIIRPLGDVIVLMPIPAMPHGTLHRMLDIVIESIRVWSATLRNI